VNSKTRENLLKRLENRRYRQAFVDSNVGVQIAAQLHAMRISRELSQEKLESEIEMNQARISLMEKSDYQKYNIKTLKRFAKYYDVALDVRFVSIREYVKRLLNQSPKDLAPEPFGIDFGPLRTPLVQEANRRQDESPIEKARPISKAQVRDNLHEISLEIAGAQ
jgi:transcriptional regulator with XRE-family HTH domain